MAKAQKVAHAAEGGWRGGAPCGVTRGDPLLVEFPEDVTCKSCFDKRSGSELLRADIDRALAARVTVGGEVVIGDDDQIHFRDWPSEGFSAEAVTGIATWLQKAVEIVKARRRRHEHIERYRVAGRPDPDQCTHSVCVRGFNVETEFKCKACKEPVEGGRFVEMGRDFRRYED